MGMPASFAIIREGQTTLYYHHWGNDNFLPQIFFGPRGAEKFLRSGREVGWLEKDDGWVEAGAVLDFDTKHFAFFADDYSNTYHAEFRHYFLPVMQSNWPGWDLRWAVDEMVELAELLGHDPRSVRGDAVEESNPGLCPAMLSKPPDHDTTSIFAVVSIRQRGQIRNLEFEDDASHLLGMGLSFLAAAQEWPPAGQISAVRWQDVTEGFLLDHDARRISAWERSGSYLERCRDVLEARWPGWRFDFHHDGLPGQWIQSGRDPTQVHFGEEAILERIMRHLAGNCKIPLQVVLDHLAKLGDDNERANVAEPVDPDDRAAIIARSIADYRRTRPEPSSPGTIA